VREGVCVCGGKTCDDDDDDEVESDASGVLPCFGCCLSYLGRGSKGWLKPAASSHQGKDDCIYKLSFTPLPPLPLCFCLPPPAPPPQVGLIQADMTPEARRGAYGSDITYVTNSELGFDYLRDNLAGVSGWGGTGEVYGSTSYM